MATRNIPWYSTYNYWPVNDLTALGDVITNTLDEGCTAYVQDVRSLFILEKTSTAAPNGIDIIAAHDGGNWIKQTSTIPIISTYANLAALAADTSSDKPDNCLVYVTTLKAYFQLVKTSIVAANGISVINALNGGKWIRQVEMYNPEWLYQATWYIDPSTGNDENSGADPAHPLDTWAEVTRRISETPMFRVNNVVITIMSDVDEIICLHPKKSAISSYSETVHIVGITSSSHTGTMATYTKNIATNNCGIITDAGLDINTYIGRLIEFNQPEPPHVDNNVWAKYTYILGNLGGGQARVSTVVGPFWSFGRWVDYPKAGTPTNGITYEVLSLPQISGLYFSSAEKTITLDVEFLDIKEVSITNSKTINFKNCKLGLDWELCTIRNIYDPQFLNCAFGYALLDSDVSIQYGAGSMITVQATNNSWGQQWNNFIIHTMSNLVSGNSRLYIGRGGQLKVTDLGSYAYIYIGFGSSVDRGSAPSSLYVTGTLYGSNSGAGMPVSLVDPNTELCYGSTVPVITAAGGNGVQLYGTVLTPLFSQTPIWDHRYNSGVSSSVASNQTKSRQTEVINVGIIGNAAAGVIKFMNPNYTEVDAGSAVPVAVCKQNGILRNLRVDTSANISGTYTVRIKVDGTTRLSAAILNNTATISNTTTFYVLVPGNKITVEAELSGGGTAANPHVSFEIA